MPSSSTTNLDIFRKHNKALAMLSNSEKAKEVYNSGFKDDIVNAHYSPEVEQGILQMCDDLMAGRLQMRIHATKNLHAKFYLCLPKEHNEHSDGWVIMGSSNISDSGLGTRQTPRYELNVAMKDYDDVKYCSDEFWKLWNESVQITVYDMMQIYLSMFTLELSIIHLNSSTDNTSPFLPLCNIA